MRGDQVKTRGRKDVEDWTATRNDEEGTQGGRFLPTYRHDATGLCCCTYIALGVDQPSKTMTTTALSFPQETGKVGGNVRRAAFRI